MVKIILLTAFLLFLLGCSAIPGVNPTPVIVVVTACPKGHANPSSRSLRPHRGQR